jgi:hypothetical protein
MNKKKAVTRYAGSLAQPIGELQAAYFSLAPDLQVSHEVEHMLLLLDHYKIPRDHAHRWLHLARSLAKDHVPAFEVAEIPRACGRGRPRKFEPFLLSGGLGQLAKIHSAPKKTRGRPKKISDRFLESLVQNVERVCKQNGFKGRGKITDALKILLIDMARKEEISPNRAIRENLERAQRLYSVAVKRFPKKSK